MIPLTILLLGMLTASASSEDARLREAMIRERLGLGGKPYILGHAPMPGGVTVWAWADGSKICRLVREFEVDMALKVFSEHAVSPLDNWLDAVSVEDEGGVILADPHESVFGYFNELNQVRAIWRIHNNNGLIGIVGMAGLGDQDELVGDEVRSRVFQFLKDQDVILADYQDEEFARLWYDQILIPDGVLDAMDLIDADPFDDSLVKTVIEPFNDADEVDYILAYRDLAKAVISLRDGLAYIDELAAMDTKSRAFYDALRDSGQLDNALDRLNVDEALVKLALSEGPGAAEALREIKSAGFHPDDEQRRMIDAYREDFIHNDVLPDLDSCAREEASEAGRLLMVHALRSEGHGRSRLRYALYSAPGGWGPAHREDLLDLTFDVEEKYHYGDYLPVWKAEGEKDSKGRPGLLRALEATGRLETPRELYDKVPDELVWEWPGPPRPHLEALLLLGKTDLNPCMDLGDFLTISYDHGLLSPDQVDEWREFLLSTGRPVRDLMIRP